MRNHGIRPRCAVKGARVFSHLLQYAREGAKGLVGRVCVGEFACDIWIEHDDHPRTRRPDEELFRRITDRVYSLIGGGESG